MSVMTADPSASRAPQPVSAAQFAWLEREVAAWRAAGVVDAGQAAAIRDRYVATRRFSLTRVLIVLGSLFLGVGVLWLVAANLDRIGPLTRFLLALVLWLAFVVAAEALHLRSRAARPAADRAPQAGPWEAVAQLLAAVTFGAVVFQAAQSLQVPAYEPSLVGVWGAGGLLYAYATAGVAPLFVGVIATTVWFVWEVLASTEDGMGFVVPVLVAAIVAASAAALHQTLWRADFAALWREVAAVLVLLGLFVAALPVIELDGFTWTVTVVAGTVLALALAITAGLLATGRERLEPVVPALALLAGALLVLWEQPMPEDGVLSGEGYAHAIVSVVVYVAAAGWYTVEAALRDSTRLTVVATGALVVFTVVQSFAVFAPIISGATLFLVLGVVLLLTGFLVDRGRRRLTASVRGEQRGER